MSWKYLKLTEILDNVALAVLLLAVVEAAIDQIRIVSKLQNTDFIGFTEKNFEFTVKH